MLSQSIVTKYLTTVTDTTTAYPRTEAGEEYGVVILNGIQLLVEIADTPSERARGLSGRESLKPGWGMLFIFPEEGIYSFWMYGMKFPLDIIWIDSEGIVVYMIENAPPCREAWSCRAYTPDKPAQYVLEVEAGFVERADVKLGDKVLILLPKTR